MKKLGMVVVMLAMVAVAIVPALAQDGEFDVTPAEEPEAACATGPSDRMPGEFSVYYYSEEEMWAAPQENVVHTDDYRTWYSPDTGIVYYPHYRQILSFEDIANILDPCERFVAEEAKLQEILAWPGVKIAGYHIYIPVDYDVPPAA